MKIAFVVTDNREPFREYQKSQPWFGTAPEALLQGFAGIPEAEVHVVSCAQQPMVSSPEKLAANIWFHSLHVSKIGWLRTAYQGCVRAIRRKLREIKPDVVHGQGTERDCALGAAFSNFPNVITIHGNMRLIARLNRARPFSFDWLAARLEAFTIPRAGGVVCITNYTREAVVGLAKRTWVVPNAVDPKFFEIDAAPAPDEPPMILFVGNVSFRKNQNAFIRALDPLAARRKFNLVFLGQAQKGEPYQDEFFRLLESRPWCVHAGFADRETLKSYFQRATLLALPSLEDNCPMVVLEAMAAQVPVMAAKVGGVPDLIEDERTGSFCNPLDADSMRTATAGLLEAGGRRQRMAAEAKKRAKERFHPNVVARRHMEIYREVLSTSS